MPHRRLPQTSWSLTPERKVRHSTRIRNGVEVETIKELVWRLPKAFTATELDWRDDDVHRVDEVSVEELANCRNATTQAYAVALCGVQVLL